MTYIPQRGDIIALDFDPSAGKEIQKRRPALVISVDAMNQLGQACVVPITSTEKKPAILHPQVMGSSTSGYLVPTQLRTLDWQARRASLIEKAPADLVDECANLLKHLLGIN